MIDMKKIRIFLSLTMIGGALSLSAQPSPPDSDNPAPLGGIALLAAAGAALGGKKAYDKYRDQERD